MKEIVKVFCWEKFREKKKSDKSRDWLIKAAFFQYCDGNDIDVNEVDEECFLMFEAGYLALDSLTGQYYG